MNSSILYSSETWLTNNLHCVDTAVLGCWKKLLNVRSQTCSDLVYIESDSCPASALIKLRQYKFPKKLQNRPDLNEQPVGRAISDTVVAKSPMGCCIIKLQESTPDFVDISKRIIKDRVTMADKTRMCTYKSNKP